MMMPFLNDGFTNLASTLPRHSPASEQQESAQHLKWDLSAGGRVGGSKCHQLTKIAGGAIPQYRSYYTLGRGACWLRPAVPKV